MDNSQINRSSTFSNCLDEKRILSGVCNGSRNSFNTQEWNVSTLWISQLCSVVNEAYVEINLNHRAKAVMSIKRNILDRYVQEERS